MFTRLLMTGSRTARSTTMRHFAEAAAPASPSVHDVLVRLTVVDPSGARKQISGIIGKTLYETLEIQKVDIGPSTAGALMDTARTETWIEPTFGEGATSGYDHVVLVGGKVNSVMSRTEVQQLEDHWDEDELFEGSRLASRVVLTKDMDGMTVYVPDRIVDDCP